MSDLRHTLALSLTFKMFEGVLSDAPQAMPPFDRGPSLTTGQTIDHKYKILSILGSGGMGEVYRAHHLTLQKDVALKTFPTSNLTPDSWDRFLREARAIAKLANKNIVQVFDYGLVDGNRPYYTMELLHGESLAERLTRLKALPVEEALKIFYGVADGLVSAHSRGIIHRDLKPANIFLQTKNDQVVGIKIVDFGIAKLGGAVDLPDLSQTATGFIFGSPLYMSPEQSCGLPVDERSDIYSFGCALYETLTGRPPFMGANALATIISHQTESAPTLERYANQRQFPKWLEALIASMLAKDAQSRISSFQDVMDVLSYNAQLVPDKSKEIGAKNPDEEEQVRKPAQNFPFKMIAVCLSLVLVGAVFYAFKASFVYEQKSRPGLNPKVVRATAMPLLTASTVAPNSLRHAPIARYFQGLQQSQNGPVKVFDFGPKSLGKLGTDADRARYDCVNTVYIPAHAQLVYRPSEIMIVQPELFQGFQDSDIEAIAFENDVSEDYFWSDKHIHAIAHLKNLKSLAFLKSNIDGAAIVDINKFVRLRSIDMNDSLMDGPALCRLSMLKYLQVLVAARLQNMSVFVRFAADHQAQLSELTLKGCRLDDDVYRSLGRLKSLTVLNLEETNITDQSLKYLVELPKLNRLDISRTKAGVDCINTLSRIKSLKTVYFSEGTISGGDQRRLKQLLPGCEIKIEKKRTAEAVGQGKENF